MNPHAQIEAVNALVACGEDASALALYREHYDSMVRDILARAIRNNCLIEIPGVAYLDLYIGKSEHLRAYKVGISKNAYQRAKSIRSSNAAQSAGDDFELLRVGRGPTLFARAAEKRLKDDHAALAVKGTEWISFAAEDFLDTCWVEQDELAGVWWRQMCDYNPLTELDQRLAFYGSLLGTSAAIQLSCMKREVKDWGRASRKIDAHLQQARA